VYGRFVYQRPLSSASDNPLIRHKEVIMRGKNIKHISVVVVLLFLAFGVGRPSAAGPSAPSGGLDSPGPPESTYSYTLEDIYACLDAGTAGSQSTFTEPTSGPTAGTGHTLEEILVIAPAVDNTNGATVADVLVGKTFWGLTDGQWGVVTGTRAAATLPKTGQTQCYTTTEGSETPCPAVGYPGQDGDYQKGVAWPNPRFITSTAGIVTDTLTGLIWLKDANCIQTQYPGFDTDYTAGDGRVTWQHALDFVAGINAGTYSNCGGPFTDWRLPNVREQQSLIHYGFTSPALPNTAGTGHWTEGDPFTGVQMNWYWSSTTTVWDYGMAYARIVGLSDGAVLYIDKTYPLPVWPVRGGQ
jgi:hypothetical protein